MLEEERKEKEREEEVKRMMEIQRNTGICFYDQTMREWTFVKDFGQKRAFLSDTKDSKFKNNEYIKFLSVWNLSIKLPRKFIKLSVDLTSKGRFCRQFIK